MRVSTGKRIVTRREEEETIIISFNEHEARSLIKEIGGTKQPDIGDSDLLGELYDALSGRLVDINAVPKLLSTSYEDIS